MYDVRVECDKVPLIKLDERGVHAVVRVIMAGPYCNTNDRHVGG